LRHRLLNLHARLLGVHNGLLDLARLSDHDSLLGNLGARLLSILDGLRRLTGLNVGCTLNTRLCVHNGTLVLNDSNTGLLSIVSVRGTAYGTLEHLGSKSTISLCEAVQAEVEVGVDAHWDKSDEEAKEESSSHRVVDTVEVRTVIT